MPLDFTSKNRTSVARQFLTCAGGFAAWLNITPGPYPGDVSRVVVAYDNGNNFQFEASIVGRYCAIPARYVDDPVPPEPTACYCGLTARNYGCSSARTMAAVAAGESGASMYPELPGVPPGAKLGDKVLTVGGIGGIGGMGVSTTARAAMATRVTSGVAKATNTVRG